MQKTKQQLCFAHGLHLALIDVIYKKTAIIFPEEEFSSDDDEDVGDLEVVNPEDIFKVCSYEKENNITDNFHVKPLIDKIRKTVKMFRKSPTKNDILQKYVKDDKGKELKLLIDCRTRWNTLFEMCQRFSELEIPLKKTFIDLKCEQFTDDEFRSIKKIVNVLNPIKITLEALCRSDMTLCKADAALTFMLKEISAMKCDMGDDLCISLRKRIDERRSVYSTILNFLQNPNINSIFDQNVDITKIKYEIKKLNLRLNQDENSSDSTAGNEINIASDEELEDDNVSIAQKLQNAIDQCKSPIRHIRNTDEDEFNSKLNNEIQMFVSEGIRGTILNITYKYLQTILPTSVECERCFSTAAYVGNKKRSRLSDETLNALIFLRNYLKN
ncbi:uncharacterized protein LOC119612145 [Lucilia sericata]|uniref:uncharacterized protein LOC119612145 n=1 Tax=Lucilia sericata TaxID=13632 RepID=UPI0018A8487B|nr:uncharacterized protein LOC119612145 [Lucilia sericata]